MSLKDIRDGEHVFGPVPGGSPLSPETGLDVGPKAVVHLHCRVRILFVWGDAEVHVLEPVDEILAWGSSRLFIHAACKNVRVSGRATAHFYTAGSGVIATERGRVRVHLMSGVRVSFYDDSEIWAGTGTEIVRKSPWAIHHKPDGTTEGPATGYRSQVQVRHY